MERRPGSGGPWKEIGGQVVTHVLIVFGKEYTLLPTPHSPLPLPSTDWSNELRGDLSPAFEVACFSERILNFVSCLVWVWLLCLSLC